MAQYTEAFREKVVEEFKTGEKISDLNAKYKLGRSTLYKWLENAGIPVDQQTKRSKVVIHQDSQVGKLKSALREQVIATALAEYKARTGIEL